ncbi:MAG: AbrB/MazE/SpoVT family DNA-binding domain-containing protein [Acetobacteraceae bacterium]|nr:AbrB/MazE/SpoVT family DNA-binding domain-containing protein [Acetobacteraceae bacterium]
MAMLKITAKGQVTLRRELLKHLGVGPGDTVSVEPLPDGGVALRPVPRSGHISDVFGMFRAEGGPCLSIEEMNRIAAEGWAGKR